MPLKSLKCLMEHIIATLEQHVYSSNTHHGYIVRWDLIGPLCKKWSRNRDCDTTNVFFI